MPCHVEWASSGIRTWKLKESVPDQRPSSPAGSTARASRARSAAPERTSPRAPRGGLGRVELPRGPCRRSATSIATNDSALISEARADAETARSRAPASGRADDPALWTTTEFSETALTIRSWPTSSITKPGAPGCRSRDGAAGEHEREHHPGRDVPAAVRTHSVSAGHGHQRLRVLEQPRFGTRSASRPPQAPNSEHRQELQRGGQADGDAGAGELHDQPHLGDDLHPVAGDRDDLAGEVPAVVRDAKGGEGAVQGGAHARSSSSSRSRIAAARSSAARSSGSSASMRWAR